MDKTSAFVSIDYDEGDPASYRGVAVQQDGSEISRWASGDPQADWAAFLAWKVDGRPDGLCILETSSITHFLFDVPGWRMIEDSLGREIIVPEDRPGFEDMKGNLIPEQASPDL